MAIATLNLRGTYNFDVYPAAIIPSTFKNAKVLAIMDRDSANREIDTQALHVQVYPYLPVGTPNDPDAYDYVKLLLTSGNTTVLGLAWINADTVELVESRTMMVKIANTKSSDVARVRAALLQLGLHGLEINIS